MAVWCRWARGLADLQDACQLWKVGLPHKALLAHGAGLLKLLQVQRCSCRPEVCLYEYAT